MFNNNNVVPLQITQILSWSALSLSVISLSLFPPTPQVTGDRLQASVTHFVIILDLQVQKNTADLLHCVFRECLLFK